MKPYYEWWDDLAPELDAAAERRWAERWLDIYLSLLLEGEPSVKVSR